MGMGSGKWEIENGNSVIFKRVNRVYFLETWLKTLNNLARLKVGYDKLTGLYVMSGHTDMGYEVG